MQRFAAALRRTLTARITSALQATKISGKALSRSLKLPLIGENKPGGIVLGRPESGVTRPLGELEQFRWQLADNKPGWG